MFRALRRLLAPPAPAPEPVPDDAPLPDPLAEEFDRLARAVRRRRQAEWEARCRAEGRVDDIPVRQFGGDAFHVAHYPPPPPGWFDAPAR